jgi:hypothetical protein
VADLSESKSLSLPRVGSYFMSASAIAILMGTLLTASITGGVAMFATAQRRLNEEARSQLSQPSRMPARVIFQGGLTEQPQSHMRTGLMGADVPYTDGHVRALG